MWSAKYTVQSAQYRVHSTECKITWAAESADGNGSQMASFLSHSLPLFFLLVLPFVYRISSSLFAELEKCILVEIENSQVRMSGYPLCCKNEVSLGCRSKAWNVMTFYVCQVSHSCYATFNRRACVLAPISIWWGRRRRGDRRQETRRQVVSFQKLCAPRAPLLYPHLSTNVSKFIIHVGCLWW